MSDDAEVARLMRAMGAGAPSKPKHEDPHHHVPVSPRGSKPAEVEENLHGLSAEEARLLKSMHATGKTNAPAKKWADPVQHSGPISPRGSNPSGPISPRGSNPSGPISPRGAAPAPAVHAAAPAHSAPAPVFNRETEVVQHAAAPVRPEEEPLIEVVHDAEELKRKEEEQAAKEAARMERLLAKKFIH